MTERVLWIDARAGLAGDMLCAALLDLGAELARLEADLGALGVDGWSLSTSRVQRGAFAALHFNVALDSDSADASSDSADTSDADGHDHSHGHGHDHGHSHGHEHGHAHSHEGHRSWADIRALLTAAELPERARARALAAFSALAIAEGRVHGLPPDEVGFHEVGAVDSIVDTVGACLLLEQLDVDRIICSPLPLGGGTVRAAHGVMSVPVPAVIELLAAGRFKTFQDRIPGERVTPTGAALAVTLGTCGAMPGMTPLGSGFGAGTRDPAAIANVVRVVLGEVDNAADNAAGNVADAPPAEAVAVLEAQVDDMPGEWVPPLIDALLAAGALDAMVTPVTMKKGRPGMLLTVLSPPTLADPVADVLLRHATTFGVRRTIAQRRILARRHVTVQTRFGEVRVKIGERDGIVLQASPEYEDCAALARAAGVPIREVYAAATAAHLESDAT